MIVLRPYRDTDYPAATRLWRRVFGGLKAEDERARLRQTGARNPGLFLLAEEGGRLVGTAFGTSDGRRGFLYHVAVAAGARRRGVGRLLVREIERRLWALGVGVIHLRVDGVNRGAIAFYGSLGFTADPPVVGMRRTLPQAAIAGPAGRGTSLQTAITGPAGRRSTRGRRGGNSRPRERRAAR